MKNILVLFSTNRKINTNTFLQEISKRLDKKINKIYSMTINKGQRIDIEKITKGTYVIYEEFILKNTDASLDEIVADTIHLFDVLSEGNNFILVDFEQEDDYIYNKVKEYFYNKHKVINYFQKETNFNNDEEIFKIL